MGPPGEPLPDLVRSFVAAIDAKDGYTSGHSVRVARYAVRLAIQMGCCGPILHTLFSAGLLHDLGKIGIDHRVLRKTGRLTDDEIEHIKQHPEIGCRILVALPSLQEVRPAVLYHHEKWDGSGYPHQLQGEAIPWMARVLAVADAYDAMTSDRPYRKGMAACRADQILRGDAGSHWDPAVVRAFFEAKPDMERIRRNQQAAW